MASASGKGRSRAQSTTVRSGAVTRPCTSSGRRSRHRSSTPRRRGAGTLRLRGTTIDGRSGWVASSHPWSAAAEVLSQLGRPEDGTDTKLPNNLEVFIRLKPLAEWRKSMHTVDDLVEVLQALA